MKTIVSICGAVTVVALHTANPVNAAGTVFRVNYAFPVTATEFLRLPDYCKHTEIGDRGLGDKPARHPQWEAALKYRGLHHYCWAMINLWRSAGVSDKANLVHLWTGAVEDIDFVLRGTGADYILRPEILTMRGSTNVKLGKPVDAIRDFQGAIEAKPDYWPPYVQLAKLYRDTRNLAKAREIVDIGIERLPDSKTLLNLRSELGGAPRPNSGKLFGDKSQSAKGIYRGPSDDVAPSSPNVVATEAEKKAPDPSEPAKR